MGLCNQQRGIIVYIKAVVDAVVWSLEYESGDWVLGEYHWDNPKRQMTVWIANSYYGLRVGYRGISVGGVTCSSSFFGAITPWRRRVFAAVRQCALDKLNQEFAS